MFETSAAGGGEICAETFACCNERLQHRYLPEILSNPHLGQLGVLYVKESPQG